MGAETPCPPQEITGAESCSRAAGVGRRDARSLRLFDRAASMAAGPGKPQLRLQTRRVHIRNSRANVSWLGMPFASVRLCAATTPRHT